MAAPKAPAVELDVAGRTVRVTSPDRVVFAERGLTKLDVVQHFVTMGDGILGALLHRPTTLERWPKGVFEGAKMATRADSTGDAFYQKRVPQGAPDYVQTSTIAFPSGRTPDQLRIDLDPQPGTDFSDAARVATHVREILREMDMEGWPKTSGGRGIHIFVPIQPRWTFTQARRATIALGRELERRLPDQVTIKWWKEERGQKIFVDYNQMARDRTIASAY